MKSLMPVRLLLILLVAPNCLASAESLWVRQFPSGYELNLHDVYMIDSAMAWAVGTTNTGVVRTTDGGWTWEDIDVGGTTGYLKVAFPDQMHGWILGGNDSRYPMEIRKTTNGGESWTAMWSGMPRLWFLSVPSPDSVWAVGYGGAMISTSDGGTSWQSHDILGGRTAQGLFFLTSRLGWISADSMVLRTTDGGQSWDSVKNTMAGGPVQFIDSLNGWVASRSYIYRTRDGGRTWSAQSSLGGELIPTGVYFVDTVNGWFPIWDITIDELPGHVPITLARTTDGGASWMAQLTGYAGMPRMSLSGQNALLFAGSIYHSSDRGETWWCRGGPVLAALASLHMQDSSHGWVVGKHRSIFSTTDGGRHWLPQSPVGTGDLRDVWFVDTLHGWVVGTDIGVLRTMDGGRTWDSISATGLSRVRFFDLQNGRGVNGRVYSSSDSGHTWNMGSPVIGGWDMHFVDSLHGWTIGSLERTTDGGKSWTLLPAPEGSASLRSISFLDTLVGWVADWRIYKTTDGGNSWVKQDTGAGGYINAIKFANRDIGWAGGDYGVLLGTTDGGEHWKRLPSPGGSSTITSVDGDAFGRLWIATSYGEVYFSQTGGGLTDVDVHIASVPDKFVLEQNYPNPFNPSTVIHYSVPRDGPVRLQVFNTLGQSVATLVDEVQRTGDHQVQFRPASLASGIYFYRLQSGGRFMTRRMVLLK